MSAEDSLEQKVESIKSKAKTNFINKASSQTKLENLIPEVAQRINDFQIDWNLMLNLFRQYLAHKNEGKNYKFEYQVAEAFLVYTVGKLIGDLNKTVKEYEQREAEKHRTIEYCRGLTKIASFSIRGQSDIIARHMLDIERLLRPVREEAQNVIGKIELTLNLATDVETLKSQSSTLLELVKVYHAKPNVNIGYRKIIDISLGKTNIKELESDRYPWYRKEA